MSENSEMALRESIFGILSLEEALCPIMLLAYAKTQTVCRLKHTKKFSLAKTAQHKCYWWTISCSPLSFKMAPSICGFLISHPQLDAQEMEKVNLW